MSSTSAIMEFTIVLFLVLSPVAQQFAAAQSTLPEYCTDGTAKVDFYQCIYSNLKTCNNCDYVYSYFNNINTNICANLTAYVCPFFRCCSACEKKAERYSECSIVPYYNTTIPELQSCDFDCSAFPYGDNQNGVAEPCYAEYGNFELCISNDYKPCLDCFPNDDQVPFNNSDKCAEEQQYFCFFFNCCPSCQSEYTAAYQCEIEAGTSTINSTCSLSCNGVDIYTPSGGFKNEKGAKSGTGIKNVATKYVILLLFLFSILS